MRIWLITIILGMSIFAHAQSKKNEIRVGVPFCVSFFDNTPVKIHRIKTRDIAYIPIPTYFTFDRKLLRNLKLSSRFIYYDLNYEDYNRLNYKDEIIGRHFYIFSILLKYQVFSIYKWNFYISLGSIFRFSGGELFHVRYLDHGTWIEEFLDYRSYNDIGLSAGTDVSYNISDRFSLGLEFDFTRYFTAFSPNQLSTAIFLGYKF